MHDLERCPICGSKKTFRAMAGFALTTTTQYYIICDECKACFLIRSHNLEQLVKAFNRRPKRKDRLTCFSCGSHLKAQLSMGGFLVECSEDAQSGTSESCGLIYFIPASDTYPLFLEGEKAQEALEKYLAEEPGAKWIKVLEGKFRNGKEEKPWWRCSNCMRAAIGYPKELTAYCPGCKLRMRVDQDESDGGGDGEGG